MLVKIIIHNSNHLLIKLHLVLIQGVAVHGLRIMVVIIHGNLHIPLHNNQHFQVLLGVALEIIKDSHNREIRGDRGIIMEVLGIMDIVRAEILGPQLHGQQIPQQLVIEKHYRGKRK